ncbi:UDP-glucuronate:xylan alpha-glucuronosyltransferase 1 [Zea mays]|uniref:UDP-glucuronate:xylan alpha-glucuronosyltransferase 1 n=1 Tax=Zea mays TaxID=4577 RepID=A0A1D6N5K8_MAIZE|nr:UDP-glucuronate:xylan alpha-glucuronosyltransferase 1 [Zea mays]
MQSCSSGAGSGGYAFMTSSTSPSEKLARTLPLLPAHDMHGC